MPDLRRAVLRELLEKACVVHDFDDLSPIFYHPLNGECQDHSVEMRPLALSLWHHVHTHTWRHTRTVTSVGKDIFLPFDHLSLNCEVCKSGTRTPAPVKEDLK